MIFFKKNFVQERSRNAELTQRRDSLGSKNAFSKLKTSKKRKSEPLVKNVFDLFAIACEGKRKKTQPNIYLLRSLVLSKVFSKQVISEFERLRAL